MDSVRRSAQEETQVKIYLQGKTYPSTQGFFMRQHNLRCGKVGLLNIRCKAARLGHSCWYRV